MHGINKPFKTLTTNITILICHMKMLIFVIKSSSFILLELVIIKDVCGDCHCPKLQEKEWRCTYWHGTYNPNVQLLLLNCCYAYHFLVFWFVNFAYCLCSHQMARNSILLIKVNQKLRSAYPFYLSEFIFTFIQSCSVDIKFSGRFIICLCLFNISVCDNRFLKLFQLYWDVP